MASASNILRSARPLLRQARPTFQAQQLRQQFGQQGSRRWQSTASDAGQQSWFKRALESEVGIKTVHFWAPVMKWALVLAGVADFARPAENLSFTQNLALTCTGLIWTRWCLIIKPKNYLLAAVNFFLGIVGIVQVTRITMYNMSKKEEEEAAAGAVEDAKDKSKA